MYGLLWFAKHASHLFLQLETHLAKHCGVAEGAKSLDPGATRLPAAHKIAQKNSVAKEGSCEALHSIPELSQKAWGLLLCHQCMPALSIMSTVQLGRN